MSKPKPITDRADRPILRTSAGLRDALFEEWERLRQGRTTPTQALAISQLAKQIVNSVRLEISFSAHVRGAAPGEATASTVPLNLGSTADGG